MPISPPTWEDTTSIPTWEETTESSATIGPQGQHILPTAHPVFAPAGTSEYEQRVEPVSPLTGEKIPSTGGPSLNPLEPIIPPELLRVESKEPMVGFPSAARGVFNALTGAVSGMTSPAALGTAGLGGAVPALVRPAQAVWAAIMAKDIPKQVEQVNKVFKENKPLEEKVEAATSLGLSLAFTAGAAKGALTPRTTPFAPEKSPFASAEPGFAPTGPSFAEKPPLVAEEGPLVAEPPKAPETPQPVSEPVPPPENAPTAPQQAPAGVPEAQATTKRARLKELRGLIEPLAKKGDLTAAEAEQFKALNAEANAIRFDLQKPPDISKIPPPEERQSTIPTEIVVTARNDLMRDRSVYDPIMESAIGVSHDALTPVDVVMSGQNPNVSASRFYNAFSATREAMRQHYGDTIKLYRATTQQRAKPTQNWATTKEYAKQFGPNVISKEVPIDDVIAVNVGPTGNYHEVIVGKKPAGVTEQPVKAAEAEPAGTARYTDPEGRSYSVPATEEQAIASRAEAERLGGKVEWSPEPSPATPEPAISFPGIGSLREKQATAMELGKIRKAEPELWKAITQHFGADTPAKIAKLAKARFEEMAKRPDQPQGPKWTTATDEPPLGTALYGPFGIPSPTATIRAVVDLAKAATPKVKEAFGAVKEIGDEIIRAGKMTDYRRSVLNWSAKLQRSFGEAASAAKEITSKVPDAVRMAGITNWIQAGGDATVLASRAAASTDPKLKAGYEAALNLTPDELAVANDVKTAFDALGRRGQTYGVLNNFRDNYVTQIWNLNKGPAVGSSRTLKDKFRYNKARTFDSFFDGEQAGYTPKTKDISKLLPVYMHEMNSVIAARQLVEQMSKGVASDGRPLVAPRGVGVQVQGPQGQATLIIPKVPKGNTTDYKMLENQPALSQWTWRTEDSAGNPVFEKADLALHPEAYARLKNVLGRSAIREWYSTRTSAVAQIPKRLVQALDIAQSETKRTMLGFFAPFHQVQEATHAVGHRINPLFNIPKIDLVGNAAQMDAARHGLMLLPDRVSESQFMEGFRTSGLVSKIPGIGPLADWYSNYLFKEYIPGLKYKTYEAILDRNTKVYETQLASGEYKLEDIKVLSAEQANAAYGHLSYADLARNPTMQHVAQLALLAPDFLEARGRFAGQAAKGAVGTKVGREQVLALATLAVAQAATAWIAAKATGGTWDEKHPFEFTKGSRRYTMRSVPEDIARLIQETRAFIYNRLNPIVGKGLVQGLSGVDYAGRKVTATQTAKELAASPIPLTLRSSPLVQRLTGMDRPGQIAPLEQLAGAMGLKISRAYPNEKLNDLHDEFLKNHKDPRIRANYEQHLTETTPVSQYKAVYSALADRNEEALKTAVQELRDKGWKLSEIRKRVSANKVDGTRKNLFYERTAIEHQFRNSLTPSQRKLYNDALAERQAQYRFFRRYF